MVSTGVIGWLVRRNLACTFEPGSRRPASFHAYAVDWFLGSIHPGCAVNVIGWRANILSPHDCSLARISSRVHAAPCEPGSTDTPDLLVPPQPARRAILHQQSPTTETSQATKLLHPAPDRPGSVVARKPITPYVAGVIGCFT